MNTIQIPASYYGYNHSLPFDWPQVLRLEGQRNYTVFVLTDGKRHLSTKNLGAYEAYLPIDFVRIHKRYIVHRASIAEIYPRSRTIRLHDGTEFGIARRRWREILRAYESSMFLYCLMVPKGISYPIPPIFGMTKRIPYPN